MKISKEVKTAILVISGIVLFIFGFNYLKGQNLLDSSRTFFAVYDNVEGFRVQVGTKTFVNIPLGMLQTVFEETLKNNKTYNRAVFRDHFPRELNAKPCNVHAVGKLFEHAGIMQMIDKRTYRII